MVKFCEKTVEDEESPDFGNVCGTLLLPERKGKETYLICKKCGNEIYLESSGDYVERMKIQHTDKDRTLVIESMEDIGIPTITAVCPKCSNPEAWFIQLQTRRADEGMTTFYRCKKCFNTWKDLGD
ncbi:MAG: transcription factor S [Candidatus Hermodarchaeota archaeon]